MKRVTHFFRQPAERGQGLVEYALILVLVAVVVIAVLLLLGPTISQSYCKVVNALQPGSCIVTAGGGGGGVISGFGPVQPTGGGVLVKNIAVAETVNVTVNANGHTVTASCAPPKCNINVPGAGGSGSGTITTPLGDNLSFTW